MSRRGLLTSRSADQETSTIRTQWRASMPTSGISMSVAFGIHLNSSTVEAYLI